MTFGLNKAFLKFEVSTVEVGGKIVCLKDNSIVGYVVVEIDYFVVLGQMERVFYQITFVAL